MFVELALLLAILLLILSSFDCFQKAGAPRGAATITRERRSDHRQTNRVKNWTRIGSQLGSLSRKSPKHVHPGNVIDSCETIEERREKTARDGDSMGVHGSAMGIDRNSRDDARTHARTRVRDAFRFSLRLKK